MREQGSRIGTTINDTVTSITATAMTNMVAAMATATIITDTAMVMTMTMITIMIIASTGVMATTDTATCRGTDAVFLGDSAGGRPI